MARRSSTYINYMSGPLWAQRKREYYSRHPRVCRSCGATKGVSCIT